MVREMQRVCLSIFLALSAPLLRAQELGLGFEGGNNHQTVPSLHLETRTAQSGTVVWAGVHFKIPEGWHLYWVNPAGAGLPPSIEWTLPTGVTAGVIHWPAPEAFDSFGEIAYGYHHEFRLLVPLTLAQSLAPGDLTITATLNWAECDEENCVNGKETVTAKLAVSTEPVRGPPDAEFAKWRARVPDPKALPVVKAWWAGPSAANHWRPLGLRVPVDGGKAKVVFYPYADPKDQYAVKAEAKAQPADGHVDLIQQVESVKRQWPDTIRGVLQVEEPPLAPKFYETELRIGPEPEDAAQLPPTPPLGVTALLLMLGGAFIGGVILNIMPCVLPVISLKILGFVKQSGEDPARVRRHGVMYALGVWFSLLVLAGVVIAAKQTVGGEAWGMQMQSPAFLVVMLVVMTFVALNLFGVFEVMLGGGAMAKANEMAGREGYTGSFFNGMLATALATPCTAPGLAAAAGVAFAQPAGIIVLFFSAVAVGLALPYVLLCLRPAWLQRLPQPGPWMEQFKMFMGFPMLGAAVWLLTLAAPHFDSGALRLGMMLVALSLAAWIFGEFIQRGEKRRGLAGGLALALVAGGAGCLFVFQDKLEWQKWTRAAVVEARAEGHPVLVDFTADWCAVCKFNKRTSIEIEEVRAKLLKMDARVFTADFTVRDDDILAELAKYQRRGVPLVLVFPADLEAEPIVLPSALTPGIVLDALDKAVRPSATAAN